jgi:hypothetical protein
MMTGDVTVTSKPGKGSAFTVRLPGGADRTDEVCQRFELKPVNPMSAGVKVRKPQAEHMFSGMPPIADVDLWGAHVGRVGISEERRIALKIVA